VVSAVRVAWRGNRQKLRLGDKAMEETVGGGSGRDGTGLDGVVGILDSGDGWS